MADIKGRRGNSLQDEAGRVYISKLLASTLVSHGVALGITRPSYSRPMDPAG